MGKEKGKKGKHGKSPAATSKEELPPPSPPVNEQAKEETHQPEVVAPLSEEELLMRQIDAKQIARPKRVKNRQLASLLPYYRPKPREPLLVVWSDLDYTTVLQLSDAKNSQEIRKTVAERMALDDSRNNPKQQIVLDLYCQVIDQARKLKLSFEQTSAMFSILKCIHEKTIETPVDNLRDCLEYMDALFCCHIVKRPPWSARIFDVHQAKNIREYIIKTYFRHFEMYKYAFTPTIYMDLKIEYETTAVEVPPEPAKDVALHDGVQNRDLTLEELLHEINLEDEEKNPPTAPAHPAGLAPSGQQTGASLKITADPKAHDGHASAEKSTVTHSAETTNSQLTELEALIAKQMDTQLQILRDRISGKLQQLDQLLVSSTNATLPIDQFSLDPNKPPASHTAGKHGKKTPPTKKK